MALESDPIIQAQIQHVAQTTMGAIGEAEFIVALAGIRKGEDGAIYCGMTAAEYVRPENILEGVLNLAQGMINDGYTLMIEGPDGSLMTAADEEMTAMMNSVKVRG